MRFSSAATGLFRVLVLGVLLNVPAVSITAQSPAIQPCESVPATPKPGPQPNKTAVKVNETLIDSSIPDDAAVEAVTSPYSAKVRALDVVIGSLKGDLRTGGVGANSMGYFVADALRWAAASLSPHQFVLAVTNGGGLRKNLITAGELRATDVFELLPFENRLIDVEVSGAQLLDLLKRVTNARDAQSGARIHFRWNDQNRPEFISAKLIDKSGHEADINPNSTYSIVIIDYLLKVGSGNYAVFQDSKKITPLNLTTRDAVTNYVKSLTAAGQKIETKLDDRFVQVGPSPAKNQSSND